MKITREAFKNIVKEVMTEESEYQDFFKRALEKTGKSIPDMSDEEKKAFFNKIDAAWQGKGEKNEELVGNQKKLDVDGDGEIEASDLAALRAGKKVDEATTSSAPGEWVAYLSMTRGKKLLKTFNTARGAKQFLSKNVDKLLGGSSVESVGIMTKKQWDTGEAKYAIEGVSEAKYPTDLKIGSVIMGQGFTRLKGVEGGKYYKVVAMDDTTATLVPSDKSGNTKGSTKVRHKLDSIEGGIKTAKRGDENGIVVIKESVNEGKLSDTWRKNNKKGYVLKVGNIELKSAGPSNSHDILMNRQPWGTFRMDYESGGNDFWVKPLRGNDFWVKEIDDIVKKVKADSRFKESVNEAGGTVRNPKTGKDVKISTALSYGKGHPAYQAAKQASGAAKKPLGTPPGVKAKPPVIKPSGAPTAAKPSGTPPGVRPKPPVIAPPPVGTKVTGPPPGVRPKPPVIAPPSAAKPVGTPPGVKAKPPVIKPSAAPTGGGKAPLGPPPGVKAKPPVIAPPSGKSVGTPPGVKAKPPVIAPPSGVKKPLGPPPGVKPKGSVPPPPPPPPPSGNPSVGTPPGVRPKGAVPLPPPPPPPAPPKKSKFEDKESVKEKKKIKK